MPHFLASKVDISPSVLSSWNDVDLSSYIPVGSSGVILHVRNVSVSTRRNVGWRKNGSTDNITDIYYQNCQSYVFCGCDSNRIIELYKGTSSDIIYTLTGYFDSYEANFFTNSVLVSSNASATPLSYVDIDVTSYLSGDTASGVMLEAVSIGADDLGLRNDGSVDTILYQRFAQHAGFIIGATNNIFELQVQNTDITVYMNGYFKHGATFHTEPVDVSALPKANPATYQNLTDLPSNSLGGIYLVYYPYLSAKLYGLRKEGSSDDIYYMNPFFSVAVMDCDSNGQIEGKVENDDLTFYQIGYFSPVDSIISAPVGDIEIQALIENINTDYTLIVPTSNIDIEALTEIIGIGCDILPPVASINIEALVTENVDMLILAPVTNINVNGLVSDILTEVLVIDETANIDIEGLTPDIICEINLTTDITTINLSGLEHVILTDQNLSTDITTINIEGLTNEVFGDVTIDCDIGLINVEGLPDHYVGYVFVEPNLPTVLVTGLEAAVVLNTIAEPNITQITIDGLIPDVIVNTNVEIIQDSSGLINIDADNPLVLLTSLIIITPLFPSVYFLPQVPIIKTGCTSFPDITTINVNGLDAEFRVDNDIVIDTLSPIDISALISTIILDDLYIYPPITQIDLSALIPILHTNLVSPENFSAYLSVAKRVVVLEAY